MTGALVVSGIGPAKPAQSEPCGEGIALVAVDDPILRDAAALEPSRLRSLDAVHFATALSLDGLEAVVTYDLRLQSAAVQAGLEVRVPYVTWRSGCSWEP